jgi:hypothetical protein
MINNVNGSLKGLPIEMMETRVQGRDAAGGLRCD